MEDDYSWSVYLLANDLVNLDDRYRMGSRYLYVGISNDIKKRLLVHNAGACPSTRGGRWRLVAYLSGLSRREAAHIERYLKRGNTTEKRRKFAQACHKNNGTGETRLQWLGDYATHFPQTFHSRCWVAGQLSLNIEWHFRM